MGGGAFERTVRMTRDEYTRMQALVHAILSAMGQDLIVACPPEVLDKISFGDVDFYVAIRNGQDDKADVGRTRRIYRLMTERVFEGLECPERPAINGTLTSFLSKERYQIDVKCLSSETELAIYSTVHANGDFCWILQNSLHCVGLALTTDGLYLRDRNISSADLSKKDLSFLLSIDPVKIREFLGLPDRAFDGETRLSMHEIFELVVTNKFFNSTAASAWAELDRCVTRRRIRVRPMCNQFVEWWKTTGSTKYYEESQTTRMQISDHFSDGDQVREIALDFFDRRREFDERAVQKRRTADEAKFRQRCKSQLNGEIVRAWFPEVNGPSVGRVLQEVRDCHGPDWHSYHDWLMQTTDVDVHQSTIDVVMRLQLCGSPTKL